MIQQGSRTKQQDEQTPLYEVYQLRQTGNPIQICWDYKEVTDDEGNVSYLFFAVNVTNLQETTLKNAGVPEEVWQHIAIPNEEVKEVVVDETELTDTEALKIILGDD